jgi:hypothetical protein
MEEAVDALQVIDDKFKVETKMSKDEVSKS